MTFYDRLPQALRQTPIRNNEARKFDMIRPESVVLALDQVCTGGVHFLNELWVVLRSVLKQRKLTDGVKQASRVTDVEMEFSGPNVIRD